MGEGQQLSFSNKKGQTAATYNYLGQSLGNYAEWKKAISKRLHAITFVTFFKWQNYRNGQQINGYREYGGEEREVDVAINGQQGSTR